MKNEAQNLKENKLDEEEKNSDQDYNDNEDV